MLTRNNMAFAAGLTVMIAACPAAAVQNYTATPLGTLGGATSMGSGINAVGDVVGAADTATYAQHAFVYSAGRMTDLGPAAAGNSQGTAINASGQATGIFYPGSVVTHAFIYSGGTMNDIGTLGGSASFGNSINKYGQITGASYIGNDAALHTFLYTGGVMTDLGPPGSNSGGASINDSGQIAGSIFSDQGVEVAFLYSGGTRTILGTLGGPRSAAAGLNASGQVTGWSDVTETEFHAFIYSDGRMQDLGTLGGFASTGVAINSQGQVVGFSWYGPGKKPVPGEQTRAFLYSDGTMYDLNSLVVSGLPNPTLVRANGINDRGQIVADSCPIFLSCQAYRLDPVAGPAIILAVEFYNASLDHYFISSDAREINDLDYGVHEGWTRTSQSFKVYAPASGNANPVCRFYIPPQHGDSHFFSADASECAAVVQKVMTDPNYSDYVYETQDAFDVALPDRTTGACPIGTSPVFRLWNQRTDSNHRYTTSAATRDQMITKGYVLEGYGPNPVDMCAPQ